MRSSLLGLAFASLCILSVLGGPEGDADFVDIAKAAVFPSTFDSTIYSGYLPVPETKKRLHYVLVLSKREYKTDPVLVWLPNKEGCSVMESFLNEVGPLVVSETGSVLNDEYAWNREANVLYIEALSNIGYSIKDDDAISKNEDQVVKDLMGALPTFFKKFPELKDNELYITGRHEIGVLGPKLAEAMEIFNRGQEAEIDKYNLQGLILGNPFVNVRFDKGLVVVDTMYNKGLVPPHIYNLLLDVCRYDTESAECIYTDGYIKNLQILINQENIYKPCFRLEGGDASICITHNNTVYEKFMRQYTIRETFHIAEDADSFKMCNDKFIEEFDHVGGGGLDALDNLIAKRKYRFLIYSGDLDLVVPTLGTTNWIREFVERNSLPIDVPRRVWEYQEGKGIAQAAGTITRYNNNFFFATVLGAGQRAAADKPGAVWKMLSSFLNRNRLE